jgi:3-mercaptopyruvate sulfurtransferase SseA
VALQLKRKGITRVHPLEGGLAEWKALGFPVRTVDVPVATGDPSSGGVRSPAV